MISIHKKHGFTLIEFIMVIVILGIIAAMSSSLLSIGVTNFITGANIVNANWQGQIAIQRMTRDITLVRSSPDITTATASTFAFTDVFNNTISYTLTGSNLTLTYNGGTAQTLAAGVNSLTFSYFDNNGVSTAVLANINYVRIALNITQLGENYTLTTSVGPRNLL
jgi:prepilin-type N-terminal cleavage/methylation domain-containing protein